MKAVGGEGISQERAEALLYAIFEELQISTVEIRVSTENSNSIKAVEKYMSRFGGKFEGCLRNSERTPTGELTDVLVWSITEQEFSSPDSEYQNRSLTPSTFL